MQYLISVIDDGQAAAAESEASGTEAEMQAIDVFNEKLQADGYWIYAGGLGFPAAATVIDNRDGQSVVTDGPFLEAKEFIAGFWVIEVPDRETALALARDGSKACNRRVEVRPFLAAP